MSGHHVTEQVSLDAVTHTLAGVDISDGEGNLPEEKHMTLALWNEQTGV